MPPPVLAPDTGHFNAMFQALIQYPKAALGAALRTDDQAIVHPIRQSRLTAKERSFLFQKMLKTICSFNANKSRNFPHLQLMEIRIAEVKVRIGGGVHVQVVSLAGNIGGLGVVSVIVVSAWRRRFPRRCAR